MAKLKFNPQGYQDLGAYALLKNVVENGYLVTEDISGSASISTSGTTLYSTNPLVGTGFNTNNCIILGDSAGRQTPSAQKANFIGYYAGYNASNAYNSNFIGVNAGQGATYADKSNFIGHRVGEGATHSSYSTFIGRYAGYYAANASRSIFLGNQAGYQASNANNSFFVGENAGYNATNAHHSNFIGQNAGQSSSGNNVNAIGTDAAIGNALSGMTIFSNASLPSYANRAAATTAITIAHGAVAGNTYLYYNQATFAIEGVRL